MRTVTSVPFPGSLVICSEPPCPSTNSLASGVVRYNAETGAFKAPLETAIHLGKGQHRLLHFRRRHANAAIGDGYHDIIRTLLRRAVCACALTVPDNVTLAMLPRRAGLALCSPPDTDLLPSMAAFRCEI